MKPAHIVSGILIFSLFAFIPAVSESFTYTGTLDMAGTTDGDLDGTGQWLSGVTSINWTVTDELSQYVNYSYTFNYSAGHDPSYFIFEVSDTFTMSDIFNMEINGNSVTSYEVNNFSPDSNNYQSMPESIYGIKIDDVNACGEGEVCTNTVTVSFDSTRLPTWGDFYARCGTRPQHTDPNSPTAWNSAWNTGFTAVDPNNVPGDGSINNHLLVPDTVVPEPTSYLLFIAGAGVIAGRRYFRKKK